MTTPLGCMPSMATCWGGVWAKGLMHQGVHLAWVCKQGLHWNSPTKVGPCSLGCAL